jgi:hypothetical protein
MLSEGALKTALNESKARLSIFRGKKDNDVTKRKKEVHELLVKGNETLALVQVSISRTMCRSKLC